MWAGEDETGGVAMHSIAASDNAMKPTYMYW